MSADLFYPGEVGRLRADLTHVLRQVQLGFSIERIVADVESAIEDSSARIADHHAAVDADIRERIAEIDRLRAIVTGKAA